MYIFTEKGTEIERSRIYDKIAPSIDNKKVIESFMYWLLMFFLDFEGQLTADAIKSILHNNFYKSYESKIEREKKFFKNTGEE